MAIYSWRGWPGAASRCASLAGRLGAQAIVAAGACCAGLWAGAPAAAGDGPQAEPPVVRSVAERFATPTAETPDLRRHVVPLLARLGCSAAACHGAKEGQGGFQLSLFGYDYKSDLRELIADSDPPRANWKDPTNSLLLNKPLLLEDHGGGQRFEEGSWQHRLLANWIAARAPGVDDRDKAAVVRLSLRPELVQMPSLQSTAQMQVVAQWSDGTVEDVTPLCRFRSNDEAVAAVDGEGRLTTAAYGDTHVIAFYDQAVMDASVFVPRPGAAEPTAESLAGLGRVDRAIEAKLARLGIEPSAACSDEEFLRRLTLDVTGSLPTADEVRRFIADQQPEKRSRKIDELLATPAYAAWWTTWLCELTGNSESEMPSPKFRREESQQWYDWIHRRVSENMPYDQLVEGMVVAESRAPGESYRDYCRRLSSYVRAEDPQDFSVQQTLPHFWARTNLKSAGDKTLAFTYVFLGIQIQCAECHKHPFDRWTKDDFDGLKRFFEPLKHGRMLATEAEYQRLASSIKVPKGLQRRAYLPVAAKAGAVIPWEELYYDDAAPSGNTGQSRTAAYAPRQTPMHALMEWMRGLDHPYLAAAYVNRAWHYYFGVGIVDPPDDLSLANPPSNRELLEYLTAGFISSGYDMKWLHREILNSRAYQRSWQPTDTNAGDLRNFSHSRLRRLPAEALYEAARTATAADQARANSGANRMTGVAAGMTRSDDRNGFLATLGKPSRSAVCERQRLNEPTLGQALFMQNSPTMYALLDRPEGWLAALPPRLEGATSEEIDALIEEAYLRTFSRTPGGEERRLSQEFIAASETPLSGIRGLLWTLLNAKEFCVNH